MKWYNEIGAESDVVISTRIRLARNLADTAFPCRLGADAKAAVGSRVREALADGACGEFGFVAMNDLSRVQAISLAERHIISPEFTACEKGTALMLTKDESVSIMICEEDHVRLQVIRPGLDLNGAFEEADKIDSCLDAHLQYAFDEKLGFLTQNPADLGTAMRASVMLHLPALTRCGRIARLASTVSKLGLVIRGAYGSGSKPLGDIYVLSNQITLGISEADAIANLNAITMQLVGQERTAAKDLTASLAEQDRIFRALGLLKYARLLSGKEFMELISVVRMGVATGVISVPGQVINELIINMQPATLSAANEGAADQTGRDTLRAQTVREAFAALT